MIRALPLPGRAEVLRMLREKRQKLIEQVEQGGQGVHKRRVLLSEITHMILKMELEQ